MNKKQPLRGVPRKSVLKICCKFTGEHPWRGVISIKLLCNFIEITHRHGCPPLNLLHIFRIPFFKNTSGWLLLNYAIFLFIGVRSNETRLRKYQHWWWHFCILRIKEEEWDLQHFIVGNHKRTLLETVTQIVLKSEIRKKEDIFRSWVKLDVALPRGFILIRQMWSSELVGVPTEFTNQFCTHHTPPLSPPQKNIN